MVLKSKRFNRKWRKNRYVMQDSVSGLRITADTKKIAEKNMKDMLSNRTGLRFAIKHCRELQNLMEDKEEFV